MVSFLQGVVLCSITFYALGRKDLPALARSLGKLTGRLIRKVKVVRGVADGIARDGDFVRVHSDMQQGLQDFHQIKYDLLANLSVQSPYQRRPTLSLNHASEGISPIASPLNNSQMPVNTPPTVIQSDSTQSPAISTSVPQNASLLPRQLFDDNYYTSEINPLNAGVRTESLASGADILADLVSTRSFYKPSKDKIKE